MAEGRNKRHFDAALDEQNLQFDRRIAQLENDLVKAAETNLENKRHRNEVIGQWTIEQEEAENIDQAFQQCHCDTVRSCLAQLPGLSWFEASASS